MVVCLITGIAWLKSYLEIREEVSVLARNPPGMGETEFYLEVWTEDGVFPVDISVQERKYTEEELDGVFEEGKKWLDQVWLDENMSADHVTKDLYFPTYIESLGLKVRWEIDNYQWIQSDGKITELLFSLAPQTVKVRAILSYGETEKIYTYEFTVVNEIDDDTMAFRKELEQRIQSLDEENENLEEFVLPTNLDGTSLVWYEQKVLLWPRIFIFGNLVVVLIYFTKEEKKMQALKNREDELSRDYPDIVYRLILLVGAGMTVKNAWEKVIKEYEREKNRTGKVRWGYEEMEMALREMNYGVAEIKAYENFGKRCGGQNYMRLATLLIQQVTRGAKGMNQLLMQEVTESEIIWRENSRKRAEEAGTKLLFPMVLLMSVVFAVLMIPAFLSMSI